MKMYVRTRTESIVNFYDAIAEQLGYPKDKVNYDCRKIKVSETRERAIEMFYEEKYGNGMSDDWKESFGMDWVCFGPQMDEMLQGDEVEIEDGFITEIA